jgi:DNA end-binding protein Ku
MYFTDELHKGNEVPVPKAAKFDKKELDLAKKLIDTLASPFKPEQYHDEYKENVEKLIEAKRKGQKVTPIRQPKQAPVIDLMQALQQSLAKTASARSSAASGNKSRKTTRKRSAKVA